MKDESHDGEGDGTSTFGCGSANERSDDHRDGHGVVGLEVGEVVVLREVKEKPLLFWVRFMFKVYL